MQLYRMFAKRNLRQGSKNLLIVVVVVVAVVIVVVVILVVLVVVVVSWSLPFKPFLIKP